MINRTVVSIVLNNFKNDSRVLKGNISLKNAGYCVQVVALHEDPLKEFDKMQGIPVHRIKLISRGWSKNPVIQLLKYFEFVIRVIKIYRRSDIFHCNDLDALPIGILIKLFFNRRTKVVYDSHEYAINDVPNQSKWSIRLKYLLENILIRFADEVITVSESIAIEYARLYNIPKPHIVLNCPAYREQEKKNLFRERLSIREDQMIFLYQGGLSKGRGIETMLKVFSDLNSDKNVLVCMGFGPLESLIRHEAKESRTIFFHPAVSPKVLLNYTSSADYGVSFIEDTCLSYYYCLPNKVFEYLMAGLPVLTSNLYEMKRLVESKGVGIVAQDNSSKGFKRAVVDSLSQDYSKIQSNVFEARKKYCWEEQEKILMKVYQGLI
jgi:glycosyltransferase involved in cell wall biosynthesis